MKSFNLSDRMKEIKEIKGNIIELFKDKGNTYEHSDRLSVALHEILDNYVSEVNTSDLFKMLMEFEISDFEMLDSGLYEGVLEKKGFVHLSRVILYCLIEQELYNDTEFNELQNIEEINGIVLK